MRIAPVLVSISLLGAAALLTACPDPGEGKAKAVVNDKPAAQEVPTAAKPAAAAAKPSVAAPAGAVVFDLAQSSVSFVGANVTSKQEGAIEKFSGFFLLDGNMPKGAEVTFDMTSVKAGPDKLTKHLKSPDFFDVAKHPSGSFKTTKVEEGGDGGATHLLTGDLTLVGTTKSVTFPVSFKMSPERVQMTADFAINRKDFGIVYKGSPDNLIADNVAIKLDVSGARTGGK
jgi:polyisoprenoid-binding protein YceI